MLLLVVDGVGDGLEAITFPEYFDNASSDSGIDGQSFCDVLASGLVGKVSLLVSAWPVFFLGRLFDDDRLAVVRRSGLNS